MKELIKKYYSAETISNASLAANAVIDAHVHFWKYDKKRYTWITKDSGT